MKNKPDEPLITHTPTGSLTRAGALIAAREKLGELGMISSDMVLPRLVWSIGQFGYTVGRGPTWEIALQRSRVPKEEPSVRE